METTTINRISNTNSNQHDDIFQRNETHSYINIANLATTESCILCMYVYLDYMQYMKSELK